MTTSLAHGIMRQRELAASISVFWKHGKDHGERGRRDDERRDHGERGRRDHGGERGRWVHGGGERGRGERGRGGHGGETGWNGYTDPQVGADG